MSADTSSNGHQGDPTFKPEDEVLMDGVVEGGELTEEQVNTADLEPICVGDRRAFLRACAGIGISAAAAGLVSEAEAKDPPVRVARNTNTTNVSLQEERDYDSLMQDNPLLKDKNAVKAYFDSVDGIRKGETHEEYKKRSQRFEYAWPKFTPSLAENNDPNDEPTEFMLFRSSKPVTITRGGKKIRAYMYVGIGRSGDLYGSKFDGLAYAKTLGFAQSTEQHKKINDQFTYGVVAKLR